MSNSSQVGRLDWKQSNHIFLVFCNNMTTVIFSKKKSDRYVIPIQSEWNKLWWCLFVSTVSTITTILINLNCYQGSFWENILHLVGLARLDSTWIGVAWVIQLTIFTLFLPCFCQHEIIIRGRECSWYKVEWDVEWANKKEFQLTSKLTFVAFW